MQYAIDSLRTTNGGYYVANIVIEHLKCSRQDIIEKRIKRAYNRSSLTKLSLDELMKFRKTEFGRLSSPFTFEGINFKFRTKLFIGDLSFLFKELGINQQFCGHCVLKIFTDIIKSKEAQRRSVQTILNGVNNSTGQQLVPHFSDTDNDAMTISDVLHGLKALKQ